jgi:hypothetical protein
VSLYSKKKTKTKTKLFSRLKSLKIRDVRERESQFQWKNEGAVVVAENSPASIKAAKKAADVIKKSYEDEFNMHLCNCIMCEEEFILSWIV